MLTIKEARRARGIKAEQLAVALDVVLATIYNWESGRSEPSLSQARKLAAILDMSIDELTTELERRKAEKRS